MADPSTEPHPLLFHLWLTRALDAKVISAPVSPPTQCGFPEDSIGACFSRAQQGQGNEEEKGQARLTKPVISRTPTDTMCGL